MAGLVPGHLVQGRLIVIAGTSPAMTTVLAATHEQAMHLVCQLMSIHVLTSRDGAQASSPNRKGETDAEDQGGSPEGDRIDAAAGSRGIAREAEAVANLMRQRQSRGPRIPRYR